MAAKTTSSVPSPTPITPTKNRITRRHPISQFFLDHKWFMPVVSICIIAGGTVLAIQLGKGYRPTTKGLSGTGLLAANSFPSGAQVYINDKLTSATDDTLSLTPGNYKVTLKKDGYLPWEKNLTLKAELVTQTNATLFRAVSSLTPLTLNGATNIAPSPDGQKLVYVVATASATAKNGLYIADLSPSALSLQRSPRQIAKYPTHFDLTNADLLWSPNSSQILLHAETKSSEYNYLLEADRMNELDSAPDVTARLSIILSQWEEDIVLRETKQFALLPLAMQEIATTSATNLYFSPKEDRLMYTATAAAIIPTGLLPKPPSPNTQPEIRTLEPNHLYVYDLTEDKNYDLGALTTLNSAIRKDLLLSSLYQSEQQTDASTTSGTVPTIPVTAYTRLQDAANFNTTLTNFRVHYSSIYVDGFQWYPNSTHILILQPASPDQGGTDRVEVVEFDSTNRSTLYSGPFMNNFVYPWPDGSKLIIMTNLNPATSAPVNLYTVDIR